MRRALTYILSMGIACTVFTAQAESINFASERVESLYKELRGRGGIVADSIEMFKIRVTKSGEKIEHIGVKIDNIEFEDPYVKCFMERKTLELLLAKDYTNIVRVLDDSKCHLIYNGVDFQNGLFWDLKDGVRVLSNCTRFSYQMGEAGYHVDVEDGANRLELHFPVNIQIVTGKNKMELEREFADALLLEYNVDIYSKRSSQSSKFNNLDEIYVNAESFLYDESMNDVTYYRFNGSGFEPIFSLEYAVESFTNLFHIASENTRYIDLNIKQWLYGNNTNEFKLPLDKLISYCRANDLNVYVGIEGHDKNVLEGSILLEDKKMKYIHILYVKCDMSTLIATANSKSKSRGEMLVNLYAYIPTDNIDSIFGDDNYVRRESKFEILNR